MAYSDFKDLKVYQKSVEQADKIFEISFSFPIDEKYSLIDQIRRSSRSICANFAEAYSKRAFPKNFYSKMTDCIGENNETLVWIDFSFKCKYIEKDIYLNLYELNREIAKLLTFMINNPSKFGVNQ